MLHNLGHALQCKFERIESMEEIDHTIEENGQRVESTPVDDPDHAAIQQFVKCVSETVWKDKIDENFDHAIDKMEGKY